MNTAQELFQIKELFRQRQKKKLRKFLPKLVETSPVEIGVYGSYARADSKATSDTDVYVLYTSMPSNVQRGELYEEAQEIGIDLLLCEYETLYSTQSIFCKNVLNDRIIIWKGASEDEKRK